MWTMQQPWARTVEVNGGRKGSREGGSGGCPGGIEDKASGKQWLAEHDGAWPDRIPLPFVEDPGRSRVESQQPTLRMKMKGLWPS